MEPTVSVLDLVAEDAADLRKKLGPADRAVLVDYLDRVRDVERRADPARSPSFDQRLSLMFDMIALAFQSDITRVASFMMAAETSQTSYEHIGVPDAFHPLSHHQNDREDREARADQTAGRVAFIDSSAVARRRWVAARSLVLRQQLSDSHAHDHYPLPAVIGGDAAPCAADGISVIPTARRCRTCCSPSFVVRVRAWNRSATARESAATCNS
jgi:hypothetical protein